ALPGVEAASVTTALPLTNSGWIKLFSIDDGPAPKSMDEVSNAQYRQVSPDYFGTLAIPIHKGRTFTESESAAFVNRDGERAEIIGADLAVLSVGHFVHRFGCGSIVN